MSEYEIVSLFHQVITGVNASMTNFLTALFAMLVASYLAAHRLDKTSALIVVVVYSLFTLGMINEIFLGYRDFAAIGQEMVRMGRLPGSSITWHPNVINGDAGMSLLPWIILAVMVSAYIASVWYFFRARRMHGETDPG